MLHDVGNQITKETIIDLEEGLTELSFMNPWKYWEIMGVESWCFLEVLCFQCFIICLCLIYSFYYVCFVPCHFLFGVVLLWFSIIFFLFIS